jgi:uncharacterized membrane protein
MMTAAAAPESIFADASSRSEVSSDRASRRYYYYFMANFSLIWVRRASKGGVERRCVLPSAVPC